jgi:hypothetical protein
MQSFHFQESIIRRLMIELVPDLEFPEMTTASYFIKDSVFYDLNNNTSSVLSELQKKQKPTSVYAKTIGAVFTKDPLLNYRNRRKLSDTVLFKKNYKRFEINSLGIIPDITFIRRIRFCLIRYTKKLKRIITVELKE